MMFKNSNFDSDSHTDINIDVNIPVAFILSILGIIIDLKEQQHQFMQTSVQIYHQICKKPYCVYAVLSFSPFYHYFFYKNIS